MSEYAQLNGDMVVNWVSDGDYEEKHRIRRLFLQGRSDRAFPAFLPFPIRNTCDVDDLEQIGIAPQLFARCVARPKICRLSLGIECRIKRAMRLH